MIRLPVHLPPVWRVLLTALAYAVAGWLGLRLAIAPGYATAIFPPAGIALVALLHWRRAGLLGVLLGSFLMNLVVGGALAPQAILVAAGIAVGASAQAWLGARLVRRWVGFPTALDTTLTVARFNLLAGPLACITSASCAVVSLYLAGFIGADMLAPTWLTWWVGDSIGVLLVVPLLWSLFGEPAAIWRPRRKSVIPVLVFGLSAVVTIFFWASKEETDRSLRTFETHADRLAVTLKSDVEHHLSALVPLERFFVATTGNPSHDAFHLFAQDLLAVYPNTVALAYNTRLPGSQRAQFERTLSAIMGYPVVIKAQLADSRVPSPPKDLYVAVTYLVPDTFQQVIGLDMLSEPARREVVQRATETREPVMSAPLSLNPRSDHKGELLAFKRIGSPGQIEGYVSEAIDINCMIERALKLASTPPLLLRVTDRTLPLQPLPIWQSAEEHSAPMLAVHNLKVGGRDWQLEVRPAPGHPALQRNWSVWLVLAGGLLFTGLLGTMLLDITGHAARVEQLVSARTSELEQANRLLRDNEAYLRSLFAGALDAIVTVDSHGTLETMNEAMCRLLDTSADDLRGQNFLDLFVESPGSLPDMVGTTREHELRLPGGLNGPPLAVELSVNRLNLGERDVFVAVLRDLRERRRIERLKREFVSTVSHELRTPLTAIRGALGLLAGGVVGALPEHAHPLVDVAKNNSERLSNLIDDLLDIEKLEIGGLKIELQAQPLLPLLLRVLELNAGYGQRFNVSLVLGRVDDQPWAAVDAQRLEQVLTNLLSNAVKFSPSGAQVMLQLQRLDDQVLISVTDHGPGIPENFRDKIFQKFSQADASDRRKHAGTGLGLAICKALVERMAGEIDFVTGSTGTTFRVRLPRLEAPAANP